MEALSPSVDASTHSTPTSPPDAKDAHNASGEKRPPGAPEPVSPSGTAPAKGLMEFLIAPVAVALATAIAGAFAVLLTSTLQKAETDRTFRASQIDAVAKLKPPASSEEIRLYGPRLAAYGEFSIPLLTVELASESDPDSECGRCLAAERSLVQIALLSGKSAEVGKAMTIILEDRWKTYDRRVHQAALRVVSAICYRDSQALLDAYAPERVVKDWGRVKGITKWVAEMQATINTAREIVKTCTPQDEENKQ